MYLSFPYFSHNEIQFSHNKIPSIAHLNHQNPQTITKLSVTHSDLLTLQGIQKYTSLTTLNIKYNSLRDPEELLRIPNPAKLIELNIEGNIIEYSPSCTYYKLRKYGFEGLIFFNNTDYTKWIKKTQQRPLPSLRKMENQLQKVQKSMMKTLKRTIRDNVTQKYKLSHQELEPQDEEETSRQQYQQKNISHKQRTPFRQISLSNANLVKSVKVQQISPRSKGLPQLVIETIQFGHDQQIQNLPLTQPTATFASQKQKQTMPFKGRSYYPPQQIHCISQIDCNYTSEDDQLENLSFYTNNGARNYSRVRNIEINKSVLEVKLDDHLEDQTTMAEVFNLKSLLSRAFRALQPKNIPRRASQSNF